MKRLEDYKVIDLEKSYPNIEIFKDETIKSPYEKHPNHKLIKFKINKNKVNIKIEIEQGFVDDFNELVVDFNKIIVDDFNEFVDKYKSILEKLIHIIEIDPIPPIHQENPKRYQLKQFKVLQDNKDTNAFIASFKLDNLQDNRLNYMFKYDGYNKNDKNHDFTVILLNCKGHRV